MKLIDQLFARIRHTDSSVLVGLDPLLSRLPKGLLKPGRSGAAEALLDFNLEILEAVHLLIPAVKLQMACYELYGPAGVQAFEDTVKRAKELGLFVIDDSKRGDIGSTAELYAQARIGKAPLSTEKLHTQEADFVTVNPYFGEDGLLPFYQTATKHNKGVFVLVRTSNPSSAQYQTALLDGRPLFEQVAIDLQAQAQLHLGQCGYSPFGAVVGATWPEEASRLRELMPNVLFLVPGYGAQGGCVTDVMPCFDGQGRGALINSSRGIIFAFEAQKAEPSTFARCAKEAVCKMNEDINTALNMTGKTSNL